LEGHATDINDKRAISLWDLNSDLGLNVEKIQNMYYKRVVPTIRDLIKKYPNKTILIISHSWVGRLMKYYFDPKKDPILILQTPQNATLIKLNSSY
jgi:probable phosphoglycerate mutase